MGEEGRVRGFFLTTLGPLTLTVCITQMSPREPGPLPSRADVLQIQTAC